MWPFIVQTEAITLPSYLVINSLAFCIGVYWYYKRAARQRINQNNALDIALAVMIGGFLGARSFHVIFEQPAFYHNHPSFIFRFWYGGFVFYGGALGAWLFSRALAAKRHYPFYSYADLAAPVLLLGYALGRVGCLAAGCCFGLPTTMPWGIHFPQGVEAPSGISLHPTQIYSSISALIALAVVLGCERQGRLRRPGQLFGLAIVMHGLGRAIIEQFRGDFRGAEPLNLSISTWLSAATIIYGIWLIAVGPRAKTNPKLATKQAR